MGVLVGYVGPVTLAFVFWGYGGAWLPKLCGWMSFLAGVGGILNGANGILKGVGWGLPLGRPLLAGREKAAVRPADAEA